MSKKKISVIFCFNESQLVSHGTGKSSLITYHFNLRFWRIYYKKYRLEKGIGSVRPATTHSPWVHSPWARSP